MPSWERNTNTRRELKSPEKHDRISGFNQTLNSEFSNLYTHMKFNIYEGKGVKRFQSKMESEDMKWWMIKERRRTYSYDSLWNGFKIPHKAEK